MFNGIKGFVLLLFLGVCLPLSVRAETESRVVAVVNGVNLSKADLDQEIGIIMPMNRSFHGNLSAEKMDKIRAEAMKNLVDSELRAQDAAAKGVKIPSSVVGEQISTMAKRFKTRDDFVAAYKASGFSEKTLARITERRLLAEKIRLAEVDGKVTVTPEKVKHHYTENVSRYSKPEEFRASHILVKVDPASTSEQRQALRLKAEALLKRLNAGEKFEELALNESDDLSRIKGGDLGYFHAGQAVAEFEEALLKMKVGETSKVVESLYGYHIIRLAERRAPRQIPFDEIQDKIRKDLVESEKKQLLESWMKGLYSTAKISYPGDK